MTGIFTIIGLLAIAPLFYWRRHVERFERLSPVEKNLQRASHGFAVLVLSAIAWTYFPRLVANPSNGAGRLLFFAPISYGLVRFVIGCRLYWGMRTSDLILAIRALCTAAAGLMGVKWFWCDVERVVDHSGIWWGLALLAVLTISLWCLLTGAVRFVLLIIGSGSAQHIVEEFLRKKNAPLRPVKRRNL